MNALIALLLTGLLVFAIALGTAMLLTPLVRTIASRLALFDLPDDRRVHTSPTPRLGGVGVFIAFQLAVLVLYMKYPVALHEGALNFYWWKNYLCGALLLMIIGLVDDLQGLKAFWKLCSQIFVAIFLFFQGVQVGGLFSIDLPWALNLLITIIWFVAIINAFNLIDGFDGVASGLGVIAALGIAGSFVFRGLTHDVIIMVALIGACLGFLKYNRSPASIFLGDCGSMFIGYTLANVTLSTMSKGTGLAAIWVPMLALGVPVFDTFLAVWRRVARKLLHQVLKLPKVGIMAPDMEHVHHRLVNSGLVPKNVAATLYLVNSILVLLGILTMTYREYALGIFSVFFLLAAFTIIRYVARIELWQSGLVIVHGINDNNRLVFKIAFYVICDLLAMLLALGLAISFAPFGPSNMRQLFFWWWSYVPAWVILPLAGMLALSAYTQSRPNIEVAFFSRALREVLGSALVLLIAIAITTNGFAYQRTLAGLYFVLAWIPIAGIRLFPSAVEDLMNFYGMLREQPAISNQDLEPADLKES